MAATFRALRHRSYRVYAGGAFVSNVGTWMQRTAQDWLVLTHLTHRSATAVGVVMALQFGPQIFLLPLTGYAADHFDRRRLLFATQAALGLLALALGVLTVLDLVRLWHVYVFALLLGCVTAFDAPARQTFVAELVPEEDLSNAVALGSTSFNAARMVGPAVAGLVVAKLGSGWAFVANAASFGTVLSSLVLLRSDERFARARPEGRHGFGAGLRYVAARPELASLLAMTFLVGTFGLNFPIFVSTMAATVFHEGAGKYGLLTSTMAVGSVTGALLSARREAPRFAVIAFGATAFGLATFAAALAPTYALFAVALVAVGVCAQTFTTTTMAVAQLSTEPAMRGRVVALLLAVVLGGTLLGAPIVGWVADSFGPRFALAVGASSGVAAGLVGAFRIARGKSERGP